MNQLRFFLTTSIGRKALMALTGSCLGLFLLVHGLGNSSAFWGREAFIAYAHHLHELGPLLKLAEIALFVIFVTHVSFGLLLVLANWQARPVAYDRRQTAGGSSIGSRTMPYTGLAILLFIVVHLADLHFVPHDQPIADMVRQSLSRPAMAFFYMAAMVALLLHISHGFWSVFQSLGLNHSSYNGLLKRGTLLGGLALALIFFLIPLAVLSCDFFLQ